MTESRIVKIGNSNISIELDKENGLLCGIYSPLGDYNLADKKGFGGVRYRLKGEDIKTDVAFTAYSDRLASRLNQNTALYSSCVGLRLLHRAGMKPLSCMAHARAAKMLSIATLP